MGQLLRAHRALAAAVICFGLGACVQGPERAQKSGTAKGVPGQSISLGVSNPTGGTIVSTDGAINVGPSSVPGAVSYFAILWGKSVTLTAQAAPGYRFIGWAGDCVNASGPCVVSSSIKTADWYVVASFVPDATYRDVYFVVTVDKPAGGTVRSGGGEIECGTAGDRCGPALFPWNNSAVLTATADAQYVFGSWGGDCAGEAQAPETCILSTTKISRDQQVSVTFRAATGLPSLAWDNGNWDQALWQ